MGAFEYTALDERGHECKGVLEGDAPRQIRQQLRDRGWAPIAVSEVTQQDKQGAQRSFSFRRGINAGDLALITRQFATLIKSGLPVEEALQAVFQQSEKQRIKSVLVAVRSRVMEGHTMATALADFPRIFSDLYRATVAAGEQSGHLDVVLERLADYTENRQALSRKVIQALIYPAFVIGTAILIVGLLMVVVVPKIVKIFDNMGQELPALTRGLISTSDFFGAYWLLLLIAGIAIAVVSRTMLRRERIRFRVHGLLLGIPLVAKLIRGLNAARFARTLSILTESGVPVLEALRISAQVVSSLPMRDSVEEAARLVREGASLNKSLDQSGYFPPMTIHLIASGETSGKLEQMLDRAAASQERELEAVMQTMLGVFGPLVILVMAGIVLLIVLAMLMPLINLNQLVV